jgi:Family of unknown function (DUF5675)
MKLVRNIFDRDGIFGTLFDAEGDQVAITLEHSFNGLPKLPAGSYRCARGKHSLHSNPTPFETFEVMDVPNHTGILFHVGNFNDDSNGCILLGRVCIGSEKGRMITSSRATFERFMLDLDGAESFTLTVEDGVPA